LLGVVKDITGRVVTLHRTYITEDGHKAPVESGKKLMGVPQGSCSGAAIRLSAASDELVLAEGIETALALSLMLDVPAWACISAHGLETVVIPDTVRRVHIGADNDGSGTGQKAARQLARRLWRAGWHDIEIHTPDTTGHDWADAIRGNTDA
jgi:putative DNA primase/helicase